jgi:hypothetical protein
MNSPVPAPLARETYATRELHHHAGRLIIAPIQTGS